MRRIVHGGIGLKGAWMRGSREMGLLLLALLLCSLGVQGQQASVTVQVNAGVVLNKITPWMTGACIEDVNHEIYGGLYAQKLFGESFEEPPPAPKSENENSVKSVPSIAVSGMWEPLLVEEAKAEFALEETGAYNGQRCQKIVHGPGSGLVGVSNRGLNHWGIAFKKGEKLVGHLYLRADHLTGPVTVALQSTDGKRTYATHRISRVTEEWIQYRFDLTPRITDNNARFAVWIERPGTLWIDQAVLTGTGKALFRGLPIRADIAQGLVEEGITFLCYAGAMVNVPGYRWKNMIGDPDKRPPYVGNWYPYSTNGFGIFDFLNFCEAAQIESAFAINIEETEQDAADLADYLTAPVTNAWGARRAADGHPAPYKVRYIEIGNEEAIDDNTPAAYRHYAERFRLLARAHPSAEYEPSTGLRRLVAAGIAVYEDRLRCGQRRGSGLGSACRFR